ncbi:Hemolymph clottable protein [Armadillidium nasatum]|uniref:Hemolymph clottable protein n=1 Tax=Armadillidium nasatum TaxID=96803 RepID=A0A5N5T8E4_9CRUS|nr:Hemolymph clottable protein [Armadillidium nasatum]
MNWIVLFFAFLGVSHALVPGMEYEYQYEGQVKIGMPEIQNRTVGTGIRCQVHVQVQDQETVAIQLVNVEVGEYQDNGEVIETTQKEEVWIANVKRSIAGLFLVEPIRNNFGRESPFLMNIRSHGHSTVEEPSLFGYCNSEYSMLPLNQTHRPEGRWNHWDNYPQAWVGYEMSRTIDFDHCRVSVNTKQTSMGNTSVSHLSQFGDVHSRHSLMRHNLTFDGQYFVLQNGTNEGHFAVNPFAMNSEKIISYSNQTYHLTSVRKMSQRWTVQSPIRILDTWHMEVSSAYRPASDSPNWIRFLYINDARYEPFSEEQVWTGINIYNSIDSIKTTLDTSMEKAATIILREQKPSADHQINALNSDSAQLAAHLEIALRAARSLPKDNLQKLFDTYYQDKSQKSQIKLRLYIDTLGASGTGGPLRVFLDNCLNTKISPQRAASVFLTMPNNLVTTPLIKEMEDYVKSYTLDSFPYTTPIVWINYARTINKFCVNSQKRNHTVPYHLFGREHCTEREATDSFLPFLEIQLQSTNEEWKQIILIHTIGNIGTYRALETLGSVANNETRNSTVRVSAVYALSHRNMDPRAREYALRTLMSVAENRTDNVFVRQASIVAILSWRPPRSWYQTLASSSWYENSNEMSAFIYFILKSYADSTDPQIAEQAQVARFFLPLTKPYAPSSRYSYSRLLAIYDSKLDLVTDFDVSSLRAGRYSDSVQRQVLAFLVNSFGGYRFSVAQSSLSYDERDLQNLLKKMTGALKNNNKSTHRRRTQLAIQDVQERMTMSKSGSSSSLATFYFSMFDDIEILLPFNTDALSRAFGKDGSLLFKELQYDTSDYVKYINPAQVSITVPSELGIPLISRFSLPSFTGGPLNGLSFTADGQNVTRLDQLVRAREIRYDVNTNYRFASKALTTVRVLTPWNSRTILTGVEALKGVNFPVKFTLTLNREDVRHQNISLAIHPTSTEEQAALDVQTVPSILAKDLFPTQSADQLHPETLSARGGNRGSEYVKVPINESLTGVDGYWRYEGDVRYPLTRGDHITLLRQPNLIPALFASPTCRALQLTLVVNWGTSKTKEIHTSNAIRLEGPSSRPTPPGGDLPEFEYRSTLLLNGTETRYYETEIINSELSHSGSRHKTNLTVNYRRSQLPRFDNNPAEYCASITRDGPYIESFDDLRRVFQNSQNSEVDVKGELRGGSGARACEGKHIGSVSGSLKISDERRKALSRELDSVCSYDPNDPTVAFITAPVYDRANFDITYQEPIPRSLQNFTYQVYDTVRGWTFPHSYFNYMDQGNNPKDRITIRGDRYLSEKRWRLEARMPTETAKFDNFKMPPCIENVVPFQGIQPSSQQRHDTPRFLFESLLTNKCIITKTKAC